MRSDYQWHGFGQFLQEIETSIQAADAEATSTDVETIAKYHIDDIGQSGSTLDDGIAFIDQLRAFARQGILVSVGAQRTEQEP